MPRNCCVSRRLQAIGVIPVFLASRRFYSEKLFVFLGVLIRAAFYAFKAAGRNCKKCIWPTAMSVVTLSLT